MVATRPMRSVTSASAPSKVSGSSREHAAGPAPDVDIVGAEGRVGVGGEQEIELAALGGAGDPRILLDAQPRLGIDAGIAPGGDVMSAAFEEQAELHLSWSSGRGVVHHAASHGPDRMHAAGCRVDLRSLHALRQ